MKEALLRRVSFDLTGLPPAPEEIAAFVSDAGAEAFAKVVDRLLASPAYGERWARHWLDVVRYADSGGYETDIFYEQAWRYRNYVIRSFNDDKAYDRFLMEQVAGDELWPEQSDAMQDAVAVWTLGEWQNALDAYPDVLEYVRRTDQVSTLSEAVLGLTSGCANCHNHKYDPLPQRDYYRLMACFEPALNPHSWKKPKDRYLADVSPKERAIIDQRNTEIDQRVADLTKAEAMLRQQVRQRVLESRLNALPEESRADIKQAVELAADKRNEFQKSLAAKHEAGLKISDPDVEAALTDDEKVTLKSNADQRATLSAQKKSYGVKIGRAHV